MFVGLLDVEHYVYVLYDVVYAVRYYVMNAECAVQPVELETVAFEKRFDFVTAFASYEPFA